MINMKTSYVTNDITIPKITFNGYEGILTINGNFNMFQCEKFLNDLIEDFIEYGVDNTPLLIIIDIKYINVECIIGLINFLRILNNIFTINVLWKYNNWDTDHYELGNVLRSILKIPFKLYEHIDN
jgi:hypothetical protein